MENDMRADVTTRWIAVVIAVAGLTAGACTPTEAPRDANLPAATPGATPPAAMAPTTDEQLRTRVQSKFYAEDTVRAHDIAVSAENGVVTLRGTVPDDAIKQRAVALAREVENVTRVEDQLQVRAGPTAPRAVDETAPGWITTKIHAKYFVNPELKPWNIDVTTASGGVVTVEGTVDSEQDKSEAVRIARETEGVTRVDDRLRVSPGATREQTERALNAVEDAWLTAKVEAKYFVDADVKARNIDVETRSGVVTLQGVVGSEDEKRQAVALARNTDGVREVNDQLKVDASLRGARSGAMDRPDLWITTKIQSKYFLDPDVKGHQINVDTTKGVVTLKGFVDNAEQKQEAEQIARDTTGVQRVVNQLTVGAR
jgi:osmotically-inducible protein OsmY